MDLEFEYQEEYWRNSRGMQLFTCKWLPLSSPKALVFLCHGYGMECSRFMRGLEEYRGKPRFLYGESMGGAVALLLHMKHHSFWDGAVLVAPMCKISEKVKPHQVVINILTKVEDIIPKWKIVPTKDVINSAFKDPAKRERIRKNTLIYQERPRLKTALEMLRTSMSIEESLYKVTLPFFVLHGEADTVTDPDVSGALYERASSKDKTIKLYPSMWHGLTSGEPDDNIDIVFDDIITWLDTHNTNNLASSHSTLQPCATTANKTTTTSSVLHKTHIIKRRRSYLCGLKRRNSLHHSAT
ncbi:caffeoylshikimate esterase isoform X3 [Arachis hypogaea]|uniref:caffeoylshikimate esterase isoform X3 n=1 Tax=Arachis hypogaea TaxID=3818 RepID=UPI0010FC4B7E|nr:caffeoylshikimate esterase isoform X4 [Arachis hypogaea]